MKKSPFLKLMFFFVVGTCYSMETVYKSSVYRSRLFEIAAHGTPDDMKRLEPEHRLKDIYRTTLSNTRKSALHHASRSGNINMVKYILKQVGDDKAIINKFDDAYKTPLYDALARGHEEVVQELLESGAKMRFGREKSFTMLTAADLSGSQRQKKTIETYLINKNEDQECDICCEEFKGECVKVISDNTCLRVLCDSCKSLYDKCPFCRTSYKKRQLPKR